MPLNSILFSISFLFLNLRFTVHFRPILVLPPADIQVIYCELTEAEKDFYEALFKRSKVFSNFLDCTFRICFDLLYLAFIVNNFISTFQVKFDQFVEQGRVLHNYASILELLLRLRQCCDHPFLVMRCVL